MGNPNLAIVVNGSTVFFIGGKDYESRLAVIEEVLCRWEEQVEELKAKAEFPHEIDGDIKSMRIYEIDNIWHLPIEEVE